MITRGRQINLAVAAVLIATAAACQDQDPAGHRRDGQHAPGAARPFTLVATGDVLPHDSVVERAGADAGGGGYDFRPLLAAARPLVSGADLAICHLEGVYGTDAPTTGRPDLTAPPQLAEGLAATGYDSCATASDHSLDDGADGIRRTLGALDRAGVRHAGSARTEGEADHAVLLRAGAARVAHLAYTDGTGGRPLPQGQPWAVRGIDPDRIAADARAARAAGADVVVVSLHWGTAWQDQPDERQLSLGRRLTASRTGGRPDVDLVLGAGAHVPQPFEKVNGTWVVYGTGDQVAGAMTNGAGVQDPRGNQSAAGRFTFVPPARPGGRWTVAKAEFVPQGFDVDAGRVLDLDAALRSGAAVGAARDHIRDVVLSRGAAGDGLVPGK
ncbi:CapA family protein [Streptomyces sp. NPDC048566]|uniref:CapA family protein n=1 Tax=Streptomyces sp. NPDC048566 TaxID=3365569 RepID=UPI0037187B76